jgi:hypothetical protein
VFAISVVRRGAARQSGQTSDQLATAHDPADARRDEAAHDSATVRVCGAERAMAAAPRADEPARVLYEYVYQYRRVLYENE